jgi:hypothetical protein
MITLIKKYEVIMIGPRDEAIRLATTDLSAAMQMADRITDLNARSNTKVNVIKAVCEGQKNPNSFLAAVDFVKCIDLSDNQKAALARIVRNANKAGLSAETAKALAEKVKAEAERLGVDPKDFADKRAVKTEELINKALTAATPAEAFYYTAQCPCDKAGNFATVVAKVGVENICRSQAESERIFEKQLKDLSEKEQKADAMEEPVYRNKALDKIAYQYVSMGLLDKTLAVLRRVTDYNILKHSVDPEHSIGRVVMIIAPERIEEFTGLVK